MSRSSLRKRQVKDKIMFSKLVRIGRNAELKQSQSGSTICRFSAAYDVGFGNNKKTQWIEIALFGNRAEKLCEHFKKGKQIVVYADDLKVDTWQKSDGTTAATLSCKLNDFDFVSDGQSQQSAYQQNQQGYQQPTHQQSQDFDSDIPF